MNMQDFYFTFGLSSDGLFRLWLIATGLTMPVSFFDWCVQVCPRRKQNAWIVHKFQNKSLSVLMRKRDPNLEGKPTLTKIAQALQQKYYTSAVEFSVYVRCAIFFLNSGPPDLKINR